MDTFVRAPRPDCDRPAAKHSLNRPGVPSSVSRELSRYRPSPLNTGRGCAPTASAEGHGRLQTRPSSGAGLWICGAGDGETVAGFTAARIGLSVAPIALQAAAARLRMAADPWIGPAHPSSTTHRTQADADGNGRRGERLFSQPATRPAHRKSVDDNARPSSNATRAAFTFAFGFAIDRTIVARRWKAKKSGSGDILGALGRFLILGAFS